MNRLQLVRYRGRRRWRGVEPLERRCLLASVEGLIFDDVDGDQLHEPQAAEETLPGWTVYSDLNHNGQLDGALVEPDEFPLAETINTVHPAATLVQADQDNQPTGDVTVKADELASTGNLVFGNIFPFWQGDRRLRIDFASDVSWVSIDFISSAPFTPMSGRLDVFDSSGTLLNQYTTRPLLSHEVETMFLATPQANIAYAVAYVATGNFGRLDNLRFSGSPGDTEPMTVSDASGQFLLGGLETGTHRIAVVQPVDWFRTVPAEPLYRTVTLPASDSVAQANFGNATLNSPLRISGTIWHDLNGDGLRGVGLEFQHEPGLASWRVFVDSDLNGQLDPGEPTVLTDLLGRYTLRVFHTGLHRVRAVEHESWNQTWPLSDGPQVVQVSGTEPPVEIDLGLKAQFQPFTTGNIMVSRSTWGQEDLLIEMNRQAQVVQAVNVPTTADFSRNLIQGLATDDRGRVHLVMRTDGGNYLKTFDPVAFTFVDTHVDQWETAYTAGTDNNLAAFSHYLYANDQSVGGNANGILRFDVRDMSWTRFSENVVNPFEITIGLNGLLYTLETAASQSVVKVYDPLSMDSIRSIFLPSGQSSLAVDANGHIYTVTSTGARHFDANGALLDSTIDAGDSVTYLHPSGDLLYSGGPRLAILDRSFHPNTRVFFDQLPGYLPQDSYATFYIPPVGLSLTVQEVTINADQPDPPDLPGSPSPTSWTTQRSDLRSISVVFNRDVAARVDDFMLINRGVDVANDEDVAIPIDSQHLEITGNVVTIRFTAGQLPSGAYQLIVLPTVTDLAGNSLDGDGDGIPGGQFELLGDVQNGLYRLTGDWNADGGTTVFDFPAFAYWFGQQGDASPGYMDLNGDGGVTIFDFSLFADNFGRQIIVPPMPAPLLDVQLETERDALQSPLVRDDALLEILLEWSEARGDVPDRFAVWRWLSE